MIDLILLFANIVETVFRVRMMSIWLTYTTADAVQLTIITLSITPILILRTKPLLSSLAVPYALILVCLQLFHDPHKIIATLQNDGMGTYPDMEGADNLYTCLLCCLELFAATLLPVSWIKSRKKSLMTLQLTIVVGFWIAMVLVSQLPIETTFMRLDRNMAECKADFNCWWEDEEKWESLKKELLGHCFIQVLAFSAIGLNVPNGKMSVSRIRGMVEVFMVWIAIVAGAGVASGGGVPYLSAPANANK